jgi:hypothetical protein
VYAAELSNASKLSTRASHLNQLIAHDDLYAAGGKQSARSENSLESFQITSRIWTRYTVHTPDFESGRFSRRADVDVFCWFEQRLLVSLSPSMSSDSESESEQALRIQAGLPVGPPKRRRERRLSSNHRAAAPSRPQPQLPITPTKLADERNTEYLASLQNQVLLIVTL